MIVNKIIRKSHRYCEDRYVIKDNLYMVIDGATPLLKDHKLYKGSSASYFISEIKKDILKSNDVYNSLSNTSKRLYNEFTNEDLMPSAGISFINIKDNKVIVNNIGDCEVFIRFKDNSYKRIVDKTLIDLDSKVIEEYSKIRKECKNHKEAIDKIKPILINNRKLMNKDNGYKVYAPSFNGNIEFNKEEFKIDSIKEIYLYTDGIMQLVESLSLYKDVNDMFKLNCNINKLLNELVKYSNLDPQCKIHPRFKKIDDITIIQIIL